MTLLAQDLSYANAGRAITVQLDREVDISRGDLIVVGNAPSEVADLFEARIFWMDAEAGYAGREFTVKIGASSVNAIITKIKPAIDVNTGNNVPAEKLSLNDCALITLKTYRPVPFDPFSKAQALGSFVLVNKFTNQTAAAGMINFALSRATNIHKQIFDIDKDARSQLSGHLSKIIWFTGLLSSGKSTISNALERELFNMGILTYILDGDNVRHRLCNDFGFSDSDRVENLRTVAEVAKLMVDAGIVVLTAFISPFRAERQMACQIFKQNEFIEVYVNTPLDIAEARDVKGLYKKARAGELPNFTGASARYEAPEEPEITIDTSQKTIEECVDHILHSINLTD